MEGVSVIGQCGARMGWRLLAASYRPQTSSWFGLRATEPSVLLSVAIKGMRDFKKLLIWQKAMDVVAAAYKAVEKFPTEERYGLRSQVTRSAVSIAANIAEGNAKSSEKEKKHCMERALGSAYELETHMLIVERVGWLVGEEIKKILKLIEEEQRMLSTFIEKLKG